MSFEDDGDATTEVSGSLATLMQLSAAEIDQQIATARRYPRNLAQFKKTVEEMVTCDLETAQGMTYALPRKERDQATGKSVEKLVVGPSVRFAEVLVNEFGNCRVGARAIGADEDFVTAQGLFWDLEKNVAGFRERKASIRTRDGKKYGQDMIKTTMNSAISTSYREAVLKGIPKSLWKPLWDKAVEYAANAEGGELKKAWEKAVTWFGKKKVTEEMILKKLGRATVEEVTRDDIVILGALSSQIREDDVDPIQLFTGEGEAKTAGDNKMSQAVDEMKGKKVDEKQPTVVN